MQQPDIAIQLTACGIPVFPCDGDKRPVIKGGFKSASLTPGYYWPTEIVGIPVTAGIFVIDVDAYKGMTRGKIEQVIGASLDWDAAYLQNTPGGGFHYAFHTDEHLLQDSDLFEDQIGKGFDTRCAGRGYICTGGAYLSTDPIGVLKLAAPGTLPLLPAAAVTALTAQAALQHVPAPLPTGDRNADEVTAMLKCIAADCSRSEWMKIGLALKHHYHDDDGTGWILFDNWSMSGADAYDPVEAHKLWETIKPVADDGRATVTLGTVAHKAIENGYVPSSISAELFGATAAGGTVQESAPLADLETLIGTINAQGGKPEKLDELTTAIREMTCNKIQRAALTATLQRTLKDHGIKITEKDLRQATNSQAATPLIIPQPVAQSMPFRELKVNPVDALGNVHIQNAGMLRQAVFGERLVRVGGEAYWWTGSCWEYVTKADLISAVAHSFIGNDFGKDSTINGTRNQLFNIIPSHSQLGPADTRIFFKNGVYDPSRPDLGIQQHNQNNFNTFTLSIEYQPGTAHPEWDKFMLSCFSEEPERITLLQEIMGWWLISDNLNHQKAVAFDGVTRSGKGTIMRVMDAIMGRGVADVSLAQLADNKSISSMRNAVLALDRDSKRPPNRDITVVHSQFNKITANEPISIPLLHIQDPWHGVLNCKLGIACNGIPVMADDSGAAPNRWIVLKFTKSFDRGREDLDLPKRLFAEASAVGAWAVEGLRRLILNGKFTMPQSSIEESHALSDASTPMNQFAEERLEIDPEYRSHGCDLWNSYRQWCTDNNNRPPNSMQFLRSLERALQDKGVKYKTSLKINGINRTGLVGVRLKMCVDGVTPNNVTPIGQALKETPIK